MALACQMEICVKSVSALLFFLSARFFGLEFLYILDGLVWCCVSPKESCESAIFDSENNWSLYIVPPRTVRVIVLFLYHRFSTSVSRGMANFWVVRKLLSYLQNVTENQRICWRTENGWKTLLYVGWPKSVLEKIALHIAKCNEEVFVVFRFCHCRILWDERCKELSGGCIIAYRGGGWCISCLL